MAEPKPTKQLPRLARGGARIEKLTSSLAAMRNRRFTRALISYMLALWLVIQVADIGFPLLEVPKEGLALVIMGGVLALPFVIVIAWLVELKQNRDLHITGKDGSLRLAIFILVLLAFVSLAGASAMSASDTAFIADESVIRDCETVPATSQRTGAKQSLGENPGLPEKARAL